MVEMVWTTMHIGGALRRNLCEELKERIDEDFHDQSCDAGDEESCEEAARDKRSLLLQGQVNYGNPDAVVAFCIDNDLPYWIHHEHCSGNFSSGITVWRPGMEKPRECSADPEHGVPCIDIRDLHAIKAKADETNRVATIETIIAGMEPFTSSAVPPITLVDHVPTEAEQAELPIGA